MDGRKWRWGLRKPERQARKLLDTRDEPGGRWMVMASSQKKGKWRDVRAGRAPDPRNVIKKSTQLADETVNQEFAPIRGRCANWNHRR